MPVPAETVPVATEPTAPVPLPKSTWPPESEVCPVPPFDTDRVPEILASVVVATHVGMPLASERTKPSVVEATRASDVGVFAYKISPAVYEEIPVPPFAAVRAVESVSEPSDANEEEAVEPKRAVPAERTFAKSVVPVAFVKVRPPLKARSVVVAFEGNK